MNIRYQGFSLLWKRIMGKFQNTVNAPRRARMKSTGLVCIGLVCGFLVSYGWATMTPPTEHKGLEVKKLGFVPEESMSAQVGLKGYILLLRKITINPGGQISQSTAPRRHPVWSTSKAAPGLKGETAARLRIQQAIPLWKTRIPFTGSTIAATSPPRPTCAILNPPVDKPRRKRTSGLRCRNGIWHTEKQINGVQIFESTGTQSLKEAQAYLAKRIEEIRLAQVFGVRPQRNWRDAATKYLQEHQHKVSIAGDAMHRQQLDPSIGNLHLDRAHEGTLLVGAVNKVCRTKSGKMPALTLLKPKVYNPRQHSILNSNWKRSSRL